MYNIVCYGVGIKFQELIKKIGKNVKIVALADKDLAKAEDASNDLLNQYPLIRVSDPVNIHSLEFDYVLICNEFHSLEMYTLLIGTGVSEKKICYIGSIPICMNINSSILEVLTCYFSNLSKNNEILSKLIPSTSFEFNYHVVKDIFNLNRIRYITDFYEKSKQDYVRISTLELVANQIIKNDTSGSLAEVGVYKGNISLLLNEMFPSRTLYLFDTFESFDNRDINYEIQNRMMDSGRKNAISKLYECFTDTSVEMVLNKMPYPDMCIIKKGYFPETVSDISDEIKFALVSIDVDLYKPTYEALQYFFPRLNNRGYIIVHDYNQYVCDGVMRAVDQFCSEQHITPVPITDTGGSIIIVKN